MSSQPIPEASLTTEQRAELEAAHRRLREAVAEYDKYLGGALLPGQTVPVHSLDEVAAVQARIEDAERELWRLREAYLGWTRPSWAPSAAFETDWFSPEDAVYDEVNATPIR